MQYQYIPYMAPLFASAFVSLSLGIFALLMRRSAKGAKSFILSMFIVTIWSFGNALEMAAVDFNTKLFWANIQYFAYGYSPVALLALCMHFTGYDKLVENKKILWFAVVPTFIVLLVWTDGWHGLMRYDMHMDYSGLFPVITKKYGSAFYIHAIYSHFLNITAWVLVTRAVFFKNTVYRNQAIALFVGISMIVIPNILYITGLSPIKRFDITPMFFGPAGLIIAWGIFRYKLFEVIPVARATVIENMNAGVMVLDLQDRVLDINPAMRNIVDYSASKNYAGAVEEVCCKIPGLINACKNNDIAQSEFIMDKGGVPKVYEVFLSTLSDHKGDTIGRLVVVYDITQKKQEQQLYLKQQRKLAVTEERERLARDLHDNLGQVLGFINLQAQGIRQELENADINIVSHKLDKLVKASQGAHSDLRDYIHNVRNTEAMGNDFITGLTKDIMIFEEQSGLKVKLDIPIGFIVEELKPNIRINILNIIKEALNNIRKHAEAEHVSVIFSTTQKQLRFYVKDDGKGFDADNGVNDSKTKFGLNIMRERALEIGGQIDIKSTVGKGSCITVIVPIKEGGNTNANEANAC